MLKQTHCLRILLPAFAGGMSFHSRGCVCGAMNMFVGTMTRNFPLGLWLTHAILGALHWLMFLTGCETHKHTHIRRWISFRRLFSSLLFRFLFISFLICFLVIFIFHLHSTYPVHMMWSVWTSFSHASVDNSAMHHHKHCCKIYDLG